MGSMWWRHLRTAPKTRENYTACKGHNFKQPFFVSQSFRFQNTTSTPFHIHKYVLYAHIWSNSHVAEDDAALYTVQGFFLGLHLVKVQVFKGTMTSLDFLSKIVVHCTLLLHCQNSLVSVVNQHIFRSPLKIPLSTLVRKFYINTFFYLQ